jgi:hypoxanthine phosphoribosyltransferase
MPELKTKPLFDEKALSKRVAELGKQISADFGSEEVICIGVLKGSVIFLADLVRHIKSPLRLEFIGVASYEGTKSTGHVRITNDLSADIKGKNVLVVEDIVDTGMTIDFLIDTLKVREPKSLKICALLSKPDAHIMHNTLDYVGFEISKEFVIGYGLDFNGLYRELPYIAQVETVPQKDTY